MGRTLHAGKWNSRAWQHGARRDLAGSLLAGGVGQPVLVVSGVLVARALGPEDRGYMALVLLVPSLLALVGSLGLPLASTYFVARNPESARSIARKLIVPAALQTAIGVLLTLGALLTVLSGEPARVISAGLVATALVPALLAQTYGLALLQGQRALPGVQRLAHYTGIALHHRCTERVPGGLPFPLRTNADQHCGKHLRGRINSRRAPARPWSSWRPRAGRSTLAFPHDAIRVEGLLRFCVAGGELWRRSSRRRAVPQPRLSRLYVWLRRSSISLALWRRALA
jgi:hypothetical protein